MTVEFATVHTVHEGTDVLSVRGEVDISNAMTLRVAIYQIQRPGNPLIADLSGVTFMDSSGLCALLKASKTAAARGVCLLVVPSAKVARLFGLTRVGSSLSVQPTLSQALDTAYAVRAGNAQYPVVPGPEETDRREHQC